ncbi:hypothetical protein D3C73_939960 [compost metagenome]
MIEYVLPMVGPPKLSMESPLPQPDNAPSSKKPRPHHPFDNCCAPRIDSWDITLKPDIMRQASLPHLDPTTTETLKQQANQLLPNDLDTHIVTTCPPREFTAQVMGGTRLHQGFRIRQTRVSAFPCPRIRAKAKRFFALSAVIFSRCSTLWSTASMPRPSPKPSSLPTVLLHP